MYLLGEIFFYFENFVKVCKSESIHTCEKCIFYSKDCLNEIDLECDHEMRGDNNDVYYEVN